MRAVLLDAYGPPSSLRSAHRPEPLPAAGEVLVRVEVAGVNPIDWKTRSGTGVTLTSFPAVLGWDICGTVEALGPGVTGLGVGDRVFGMVRFPQPVGAYAEYVAAPVVDLAAVPAGVDAHAAASAMLALTAWQSLFTHARTGAGQRVLVHGAAGGVGHASVQLAVAAGAEVIGTASERNHAFLGGLGAAHLIDYTAARVENEVKDVDVVIDTRGGEDWFRLLDVLRPGGTIVSILGEHAGYRAAAAERGVAVGFTYVGSDPAALGQVAEAMAAGSLAVAVDEVFALEEAGAAHTVGERGHVRGQLVLDLR